MSIKPSPLNGGESSQVSFVLLVAGERDERSIQIGRKHATVAFAGKFIRHGTSSRSLTDILPFKLD